MRKLNKHSISSRVSRMLKDVSTSYAGQLTSSCLTNEEIDPHELESGEKFFYFSNHNGTVVFCQKGKNEKFYAKDSWNQANRKSNELCNFHSTFFKADCYSEAIELYTQIKEEVERQL